MEWRLPTWTTSGLYKWMNVRVTDVSIAILSSQAPHRVCFYALMAEKQKQVKARYCDPHVLLGTSSHSQLVPRCVNRLVEKTGGVWHNVALLLFLARSTIESCILTIVFDWPQSTVIWIFGLWEHWMTISEIRKQLYVRFMQRIHNTIYLTHRYRASLAEILLHSYAWVPWHRASHCETCTKADVLSRKSFHRYVCVVSQMHNQTYWLARHNSLQKIPQA